MGFHHLAVATTDLAATHRFYTDAMGFTLVKVDVIPTESDGGWAKHAFYDTGGQGLLAFWELHDETLPDFDPALSTAHGLPTWVNHVAFDAPDREALALHCDRWLAYGIDVAEIDHGWCVSIYATDPNGTLVEWCTTTAAFTDRDREQATQLLEAATPTVTGEATVTIHKAPVPAATS
jgi:catechol 2,3-dioxygenase-like lactoylglutathione lyase family enzyme